MPNMNYEPEAHETRRMHILLKTNLQWAKDEEHDVKTEHNQDETDESHRSQLKFE